VIKEIPETAADRDRRLATHAAIQQAACPRCGRQPGKKCQMPGGREAGIPHQERRDEAIRQGLWTS